jgi:membrane protein implicated in regulation of membrane protease activity
VTPSYSEKILATGNWQLATGTWQVEGCMFLCLLCFFAIPGREQVAESLSRGNEQVAQPEKDQTKAAAFSCSATQRLFFVSV